MEAAIEEDWSLPVDFNLYSTHEIRRVYYHKKRKKFHQQLPNHNEYDTNNDNEQHSNNYFKIECIEPSSPLDITATSPSARQYDATGHCVWTGSFLLISCMDQILDIVDKQQQSKNRSTLSSSHSHDNSVKMIELGCGTGVGGLSIMFATDSIQRMNSHDTTAITTKSATTSETTTKITKCYFTDTDPAALQICQRNCELNGLILNESFTIRELTWGDDDVDYNETFDIILATDVLYDVDLIKPLFTSVSLLLSKSNNNNDDNNNNNNAIFILSHVPRACYNLDNPPEAIENLEQYIIDQGELIYGLELIDIVRYHKHKLTTSDDDDDDTSIDIVNSDNNIDSFPDGSAVLIFGQRKKL